MNNFYKAHAYILARYLVAKEISKTNSISHKFVNHGAFVGGLFMTLAGITKSAQVVSYLLTFYLFAYFFLFWLISKHTDPEFVNRTMNDTEMNSHVVKFFSLFTFNYQPLIMYLLVVFTTVVVVHSYTNSTTLGMGIAGLLMLPLIGKWQLLSRLEKIKEELKQHVHED